MFVPQGSRPHLLSWPTQLRVFCHVSNKMAGSTSIYIISLGEPSRWAPTSYKLDYSPHKWPYKWVSGVIPTYNWQGPTLLVHLDSFLCIKNFTMDPWNIGIFMRLIFGYPVLLLSFCNTP